MKIRHLKWNPHAGREICSLVAPIVAMVWITSCHKPEGNNSHAKELGKSTDAGDRRAHRITNVPDIAGLIAGAEANSTSRRQAYLEILKKGVTPEEAGLILSSILSATGPGQDRNNLLQDFFFEADLSLENALLLMNNLSGTEKERADMGLACRIGLKSDLEFLHQPASFRGKLSASELAVIGSGLSLRIDPELSARVFGYKTDLGSFDQSEKDNSLRESIQILHSFLSAQEPGVASDIYSGFFENCARAAPTVAWSEIHKLAERHPDFLKSNSNLLQSVISSMAIENPEAAFRVISKPGVLAGGSGLETYAYVAFGSLLTNDSKAAIEWLEAHSSNLAPPLIDGCNMAKASFYSKSNDFELARQAVDSLSDPELRSKTQGQVWGAERDALTKELQAEPSKTIESIVSGNSKYADYWLEEAMGTWVARDFEKANDWYQQNWNNMPAVKSQYVAAAFANQAVEQGDLATARQWAALIQDTKTKQRIDAGITKAEGQNRD